MNVLQIKSCPSHCPKILREWNHESDSLESVEAEEIERERNIGEKLSIVCFNWAEYLLRRPSDGSGPVQNRESCVLIARKKYSASAKRNRLHPKRALPLWDCLSPIEYFFQHRTIQQRTWEHTKIRELKVESDAKIKTFSQTGYHPSKFCRRRNIVVTSK